MNEMINAPKTDAMSHPGLLRRSAQRKGRNEIERKRRSMIVVDHDANIGLQLRDPFLKAHLEITARLQQGR